ncbi:hypothetical protein KFE25_007407 [Diacronema lutheri]|uniref:SEP domain-containing protein n=1 Tax=Diacronema lutheri TaxID=2081491 RepID=A0A8J5XZS9_DIALT|nr:hypothetical protein KFE25_007407 [Diacronema lutheri]
MASLFRGPVNADEALDEFRRQRALRAPQAAPSAPGDPLRVDSLMAAMGERVAQLEGLRQRGALAAQRAQAEEAAAIAAPAAAAGRRSDAPSDVRAGANAAHRLAAAQSRAAEHVRRLEAAEREIGRKDALLAAKDARIRELEAELRAERTEPRAVAAAAADAFFAGACARTGHASACHFDNPGEPLHARARGREGPPPGASARPLSGRRAALPVGACAHTAAAVPSPGADPNGLPLRFRGVQDVPAVLTMLRGLSELASEAAAECAGAAAPGGVHALGRAGVAAAAARAADALSAPAGGVRLPVVPISMYEDGFLLFAGPPREYGSAEASSFLDEVLRGNFPYELKSKCPHGAAFEVFDRSGERLASRARRTKAGARSVATLESARAPDAPVDAARFLARLPASVVRGGRIVAVRSEVAQMLHAPGALEPACAPRAPVAQSALARADAANVPGETPRARVQLKLPAGAAEPTVLVVLPVDAPLSALRASLGPLLPHVHSGGSYSLRCAFPAATFDGSSGASLASLGLAPSATLHVQLLS